MQPFSRPIGQGPPQSNGMCLAEFSVYSNLKPCASTDRIVDFPQVTSCGPGPVSLPGAFISCGYFPWTGRSADRRGPGLDLADDADAPLAEIGRNLIGDIGSLHAPALPAAREAFVDPAGKAASAAANDCRQCLHLPVVGVIIDIEARDPGRLSRPEITLPTADPNKAEIIELNIAVTAFGRARTAPIRRSHYRAPGQRCRGMELRSCSCRTSRRRYASSECRSS